MSRAATSKAISFFIMSNIEKWRPVLGYEGIYEVSNLGNVKSLFRIIERGKIKEYPIKERILKKTFDGNYYCVGLYKNKKLQTIRIHRLVGLVWKENPNNHNILNHIDSDKLNNFESNLEWVSHLENSSHSFLRKQNYCGVHRKKKGGYWVATITYKKQQIHLGSYKTELEAYASRCKFEKENGIVNKYL